MGLADYLTAEAVNRILPQINPNIDLEQKASGSITASNMKWLQKLLSHPGNLKYIEKLIFTAMNYGKADIEKLKAVEIKLVTQEKEDNEHASKDKEAVM